MIRLAPSTGPFFLAIDTDTNSMKNTLITFFAAGLCTAGALGRNYFTLAVALGHVIEFLDLAGCGLALEQHVSDELQ